MRKLTFVEGMLVLIVVIFFCILATACYEKTWRLKRLPPNFEKRKEKMPIPARYFVVSDKLTIQFTDLYIKDKEWCYKGNTLAIPVLKQKAFNLWIEEWQFFINNKE